VFWWPKKLVSITILHTQHYGLGTIG
jgi:hypothetical protein